MKAFVIIFAVALSIVSNSCDKFDTFPLNVPFSIDVSTSGSTNPTNPNPVSYCLTESQTYMDYVNDINKLTFIEAAWRTTSTNISKGDVTVTVKVVNGQTLFQKTLSGINPSDYKSPNAPYVLSLTAAEIDLLNTYLETFRSNPNNAPCLQAYVVANVTTGSTPYSLVGVVDMVVEAETKL